MMVVCMHVYPTCCQLLPGKSAPSVCLIKPTLELDVFQTTITQKCYMCIFKHFCEKVFQLQRSINHAAVLQKMFCFGGLTDKYFRDNYSVSKSVSPCIFFPAWVSVVPLHFLLFVTLFIIFQIKKIFLTLHIW